jgi:hypothetical protein
VRRDPEIPSAQMVQALTTILGQAEELLLHGIAPEIAINHALWLQRPSVAIEIVSRVAWAQCISPMTTAGPAELRVWIEPVSAPTREVVDD